MACPKCGNTFTKTKHSCAICKAAHNHSNRAKGFGCQNTLTASQIWSQVQAQNMRCYWCAADITKSNGMIADHLISMSKGGNNTLNNVVIACHACNHSKSTLDIYRWLKRIGRDPVELAWVLAEQHAYFNLHGYPSTSPRKKNSLTLAEKLQLDILNAQITELEKAVAELGGEKSRRLKLEAEIEILSRLLDKTWDEERRLRIEIRKKYPDQPEKWAS